MDAAATVAALQESGLPKSKSTWIAIGGGSFWVEQPPLEVVTRYLEALEQGAPLMWLRENEQLLVVAHITGFRPGPEE